MSWQLTRPRLYRRTRVVSKAFEVVVVVNEVRGVLWMDESLSCLFTMDGRVSTCFLSKTTACPCIQRREKNVEMRDSLSLVLRVQRDRRTREAEEDARLRGGKTEDAQLVSRSKECESERDVELWPTCNFMPSQVRARFHSLCKPPQLFFLSIKLICCTLPQVYRVYKGYYYSRYCRQLLRGCNRKDVCCLDGQK